MFTHPRKPTRTSGVLCFEPSPQPALTAESPTDNFGSEQCVQVVIAQRVVQGIFSGVTTEQLDTLAAETGVL